MIGWKEYRLAEIVKFYNGKAINYQENGIYPVYGSNGQVGYAQDFKYDNIIIIGRVGAYCGAVFYVKEKCWATDNTIVAKEKENVDIKFLYNLLKILDLNNYAGGSAQPLLTQGWIKPIKIKLPSLSIQKIIAKILSNYDDLIENNLKRIKLLEESARLTYEEWFLRFRIDGEKLEIDSETGLPFGWEELKLKDLIKFYNGKACTIGQSKGEYPVYGSNGKVGKLDQFKYENVIIIGRVGAYCGTVFYVKEKCWATDNTIIVKPKKNDIFFLYYSLDIYNLNNYAGGSAQPLLTQGWLKPLKIKYPTEELITRFDKVVEPMFNEIKNLQTQNQLLKEVRDILLPRLMTGMIDVDELEVAV